MTLNHDQLALRTEELVLGYGDSTVVDGTNLDLTRGEITAIIGPNGCGKSTLLRGLGKLLSPRSGRILLDGRDLARLPAKQVALKLGLLPQQPIAPDGVTVADLVGRGRHPHQKWFRQWSDSDEAAVDEALRATSLQDQAHAPIDQLSGGQRQRVWIALALAQDPEIMLLDEPTTYLDLAHQVEVLNLLRRVNHESGLTIVMVLHDLNMACRYADQIVMMRDGAVVHHGTAEQVVTAESVRDVFGLNATVMTDPVAGTPLVLPELPLPARSEEVGPRHRVEVLRRPSPGADREGSATVAMAD